MKRRETIFFAFFCALFLLISADVNVEANDGSLQLNPNVITNSEGGIGNIGEFPIVGKLFTPAMDRKIEVQMEDQISEKRQAIDFSNQGAKPLYSIDTDKVSQQLFLNYTPQLIIANEEEDSIESNLWYWLLLPITLFIVFFGVYLGQKQAKRSKRKRR